MFARAARNCKVGSEPAYRDALRRKDDLRGLVAGDGLMSELQDLPAETDWAEVCDRAPLMQRIEQAVTKVLAEHTAERARFDDGKERIRREAELVSTISLVLRQKGREDAGDEEYVGHTQQLGTKAVNIAEAAKRGDFDAAREAVSNIGKTCANCHESFR